MSRERFDEIKDIINKAVKDRLQVKLIENKIISMTKIKNLINCINTSDPKSIDKETYDMYQENVQDSRDLYDTINKTGNIDPRQRLLDIMYLVEEILVGKKSKLEESEKLDIAQGRIDTKSMPPLESEEEEVARKTTKRSRLKNNDTKMIVRLPVLLTQLKAGNNSQKLKK